MQVLQLYPFDFTLGNNFSVTLHFFYYVFCLKVKNLLHTQHEFLTFNNHNCIRQPNLSQKYIFFHWNTND